MKNVILPVLIMAIYSSAQAQYKVRFMLNEKTTIHNDSIYVTGTFSNWDSTSNRNFLLKPLMQNEKSITLNLPAGALRYKFHRGSWLTVEKLYNGDEVEDRSVTINRDTVFYDTIASWRDQLIADKQTQYQQTMDDSVKLQVLINIAYIYQSNSEVFNADSAMIYAYKAAQLQGAMEQSEKNKSENNPRILRSRLEVKSIVANLMSTMGNYTKSLELKLEILDIAEKLHDNYQLLLGLTSINRDYSTMNDFKKVIENAGMMFVLLKIVDTSIQAFNYFISNTNLITANAYYKLNQLDSALYYAENGARLNTTYREIFTSYNSQLLGDIYARKDDLQTAFYHYRLSAKAASRSDNVQQAAKDYEGMARLFKKEGNTDSALYYARQALDLLTGNKAKVQVWGENSDVYIAEISPFIAGLYKEKGKTDSAYKYMLLAASLKDSLYNTDKVRQFQMLDYNEQSRKKQIEQQLKDEHQHYQNRIRIYGLIGIMVILAVIAILFYRNYRHKQKANDILQLEKQKVETTLSELKLTQQQLIQSEKMASLGELTAGIAHEIQNPLNFVNNFSEVSNELVNEMNDELNKGDIEGAKEIGVDIKQNLEKINHHGKRAEAIVKGMLQHSRKSSGEKTPTDINALADEYLRLAYHGLRAKNKDFNAVIKTDFDNSLGNVNIVPQDIGRVLLNLYNNAFYALYEKAKQDAPGFEPTLIVNTKKTGNKPGNYRVEITVRDNGSGVPQHIIDKIFQPFFTTKPTGYGTGLGLSLAYDIVKAHGGELMVETKENEGSDFIIKLPLS